ncbi:hypothetical protein [Brevundimonas sp. P7753]|jgi:hypothetical protein|uniref:hypothetical protein n=1 Tax=Brevundimonas TaxID=41275 RepID=UPI0015BC718E|nr:hypothetical protein [Brevundimonas sp. P7753]MBD3832652.1 hypothetical protein [Brevundimonas sp.]NWE51360.1 hypothetical protein [Brevundimonas sp. P7753]
MRRFAFLAPLTAAMALAGAVAAQPSAVVVTVSPDFAKTAAELGEREVQQQADDLARTVERVLNEQQALDGARIELVITDLKPNRPTIQQATDKPGLDMMRSISIGGAAIEGTITTASGEVQPVKYERYSNNLADVRGYSTWQDAGTAFNRLARNLAEGRYVVR